MSKSVKAEFPETDNSKATARVVSVRQFRTRNRRIDYYPSPEASAKLDQVRELNPNHPIGELIDYLIANASKPVSGNAQR